MSTEQGEASLAKWVGREDHRIERVDRARVMGLAATLDYSAEKADLRELPPLWHWLCFQPIHRQSESGQDGHASRGGFLPPIQLPRRMWAGSRVCFDVPIQVDELLERRSVIESVKEKNERTGQLMFVTVRHEYDQFGRRALTEWQDIVYREDANPSSSAPISVLAPAVGLPVSADWPWERTLTPDQVLLFRYSAVTFNAHRIHYDRAYAQRIEGYADLVAHGPLQATLLMELLRRTLPMQELAEFRFRGVKPAFVGHVLRLAGRPDSGGATLVASDDLGQTTMEASVIFKDPADLHDVSA